MAIGTAIANGDVTVSCALPAERLRPYVSAYSLTVVAKNRSVVFDQVYPEWPNVRMTADGEMAACIGPGPLRSCNPICAIGPTSRATRYSAAPGHYWTVGLLPLGWARFIGIPACEFADRWEIVGRDGPLARLAPLLACQQAGRAFTEVTSRFDAHLLGLLEQPACGEDTILDAHHALLNPDVTSVKVFAERVGLAVRSLERLSLSAFGFNPRLLLRRQRFLRTLGQFMRDPSLSWAKILDHQYVDQPHFIRDFRRFMDTTPSAFAAEPHPVLWAATEARIATAGQPMQVLQPLSQVA